MYVAFQWHAELLRVTFGTCSFPNSLTYDLDHLILLCIVKMVTLTLWISVLLLGLT